MNGFNGANGGNGPAPDGNGVFGPEAVDEQIALRLAPGAPADAETRLVRDLATVYALPRGESEAALARARERVMAGRATSASQPPQRAGRVRDMSDARDMSGGRPEWQPPTATPPQGKSRARGWLAGAALVVIVALMGVLFHGLIAGRTANPPEKTTPVPVHTPTAHALPSPTPSPTASTPTIAAPWQVVPGLSGSFVPTLAPSDPQVAYMLTVGITCKGCQVQADLKQTLDAGQRWTERTLPSLVVQNAINVFAAVYVSPLDPQTLVLATAGDFGASCPAGPQASTGTGGSGQLSQSMPVAGAHCAFHFRSSDGGLHWHNLSLPTPGFMGGADFEQHLPPLVARGSDLYTTINPQLPATSGVTPGARLVESQDGGATWRLIDGDLAAAGQAVFDYTVAPGSATIFAVTDVAGFQGVTYSPHYELWRSDDDGAHWTRAGTFPAMNPSGMLAVQPPGASSPVLYMLAQTTDNTLHLFASADEGQHWAAMPTAGVDAGLSLAWGPVGSLSDGSVVLPFSTSSTSSGDTPLSFYAWKSGQSQLARLGPPLDGTPGPQVALIVPTGPAGPAALWVMYGTTSSNFIATLPLAGN